jgi:hypothetical protein
LESKSGEILRHRCRDVDEAFTLVDKDRYQKHLLWMKLGVEKPILLQYDNAKVRECGEHAI